MNGRQSWRARYICTVLPVTVIKTCEKANAEPSTLYLALAFQKESMTLTTLLFLSII